MPPPRRCALKSVREVGTGPSQVALVRSRMSTPIRQILWARPKILESGMLNLESWMYPRQDKIAQASAPNRR